MPTIISGKRRGARLRVPEGLGVRPTLQRVREALFSMLFSELGTFEDCQVLDPFAGAGLLGLEAWSRGAAHVDFMESNRVHFDILKKNIEQLRAATEVTACLGKSPQDWYRFQGRQYDLVLCDPPYAAGLIPETLESLVKNNLLRPGALISIESSDEIPAEIPQGFQTLKTRFYGKCRIDLLTPSKPQ